MKNEHVKILRAGLISTLIIWIATYTTAIKDIFSDVNCHAEWAMKLNDHNLFDFMTNYIAYPLWHILFNVIYRFFPDLRQASASTTAFFNCLALWGVMFVWKKFSSNSLEFGYIAFYSTCLLFVGPLMLPVFSPNYYLGIGSGNVWHNPTNIAVKGMAILSFYIIVCILESTKTERELLKYYLTLAILLVFSVLAKPSFFQGIVPGLGLYFIFILLTKGFNSHIKRFLCIIVSFIPSACIIIFQFICSFFIQGSVGQGEGIGIEFGRVLHHWVPNLGGAFLLAFAFPIAVLVVNFRCLISKTSIQVALFYEFAAWLESVLLYEKGSRELHGNWLWGSYISMFMIWMVFLIEYIKLLSDEEVSEKRKKFNLCIIPLLFLHLLYGINFWYQYSSFC